MKRKTSFIRDMKRYRVLNLMLIPGLLSILFVAYIPMSGLVLAFKSFQYDKGIFGSAWCGFENFRFFFNSGTGWRVTKNTIILNLLNLFTSQGIAILVAVVVTEMNQKHLKKLIQSATFIPYFISWTVVGAFVYNIFNYESGILNSIVVGLGGEKINVYQMPGVWKWIIMAFNCWKWVGYNSVIYIAAMLGVDQACVEAAEIDGANVFQRIWHITFPSIRPTIIVILLLNVGRILRGDFQMFFQIVGNNGQLFNSTDVIDTYVFRALASGGDVGMTAAATFYQSLLCFIIIVTVNAIVKKIDADYALF